MRKHHHYSITQHNNLRVERSALARKLSLVNILIHRDTPPAMMKLCCHFQYKQNRNITTIIQLWRYCHNYYYCFWFLFRWLTSPELLQVRLGPPNTYSWKLLEHIFYRPDVLSITQLRIIIIIMTFINSIALNEMQKPEHQRC